MSKYNIKINGGDISEIKDTEVISIIGASIASDVKEHGRVVEITEGGNTVEITKPLFTVYKED